jgi:large subunit ribosomal protein L6
MHGGVKEVMTTSRIGRKPILIPAGVEIKMHDNKISIKGPKGHLDMDLHPYVLVKMKDNQITVQPNTESKKNITGSGTKLYRSIAGTIRANIFNLVYGVSTGYERKLNLVGVGYRAQAKGKVLSLSLGFSHPTEYHLQEGVTAETPTQTEIIIKGVNKEKVGQAAAEIRSFRGPEPYKGKGVRYAGEVIELKETKKK